MVDIGPAASALAAAFAAQGKAIGRAAEQPSQALAWGSHYRSRCRRTDIKRA